MRKSHLFSNFLLSGNADLPNEIYIFEKQPRIWLTGWAMINHN